MKTQNEIILSLGTNMGHKLENLLACIDAIHHTIGTVIKVSKVYETPAWGFEGEAFYNCAITVYSHRSAQKILNQILKLEKELGRIRSHSGNYESRIIDIDMISFNNEIIETENLKIPHLHLHNRKFVLFPLRDVAPKWNHPKLNKNISELIITCEDTSEITVIGNLKNPIENLDFQQLNYIAIEGNIGAGKTTLATKIAEDCNAKTVFERFADNPFLPKFYKDQSRYAFPLEMSFLADRYQQLSDDLAQFDLFKDFVVADYHIFK